MSKAVSIRVEFKRGGRSSGAISHSYRTKIPSYVDTEKTSDNVIVYGSDEPPKARSIRSDIEAYSLKNAKKKWRSDSPTIIDGIITYGRNANTENNILLDKAAKQALHNIIESAGMRQDALVYLIRHEDESRTHYHFCMKPQLKDGRSAGQTFNKFFLQKLQDITAKAHSDVGLDIVRGKSKAARMNDGEKRSAYIHRSVRELHSDLPKEIEDLKTSISVLEEKKQKTKGRLETSILKLEAARNDANAKESVVQKLEKRVENYEARISNYEDQLENLKARGNELSHGIQAKSGELEGLKAGIQAKSGELEGLKAGIQAKSRAKE